MQLSTPAGRGLAPASSAPFPAGTPAAGPRPDFFIVGAPKCGTTALSDYLAMHPEIFMGRKEMHYFGSDLRFAGHFYRRRLPEYLAEFGGWQGQRRTGEASVWYLFSETAAGEIRAFNPSARIIILLREPAAMLYSLFCYFRFDGNEPLAGFAEALAAEPDRRAGRRLGRQTYFAPGLVYHDTARFVRQVRRYFEIFGRANVHVILQEDLAANPAGVYRDTLKFLGVDATHTLPQFAPVNEAQTIKSPAFRALLNDPALRSAILRIRPWLPSLVFYGLHRAERLLQGLNSSVQKPPPLDPLVKLALQHEFAGEVEELSRLVNRDLSHWLPRTSAQAYPSSPLP